MQLKWIHKLLQLSSYYSTLSTLIIKCLLIKKHYIDLLIVGIDNTTFIILFNFYNFCYK